MINFMKIEKGILKIKNEYFIEKVGMILKGDESVCLLKTDIKYGKHEVFEATKQGYKLFVYNDNNNWEIFDKGNCIGKDGIIAQWEIMKVLNG